MKNQFVRLQASVTFLPTIFFSQLSDTSQFSGLFSMPICETLINFFPNLFLFLFVWKIINIDYYQLEGEGKFRLRKGEGRTKGESRNRGREIDKGWKRESQEMEKDD